MPLFFSHFQQDQFQGCESDQRAHDRHFRRCGYEWSHVKKGRFGLDIGNQPMGQMKFDSVGGNFSKTDFEGLTSCSRFRVRDLKGVNLRNTNLQSHLSKADQTGADLTGAHMEDAILDGAIMTHVKGLEAIKGYDIAKGKCIDCALK